MEITYLGTCDLASITKEGKLNLMGIFRQIFVQKIPINYPKFTLVAMLKNKENTQQEITITITAPNKTQILKQQLNIRVGSNGVANIFFDVANLPLQHTGDYVIEIQNSKNKTLATSNLNIIKVKPKQQPDQIN